MNIVFYGGGNIAQAFIEGLINSGYKRNNIFYIDRNIKNKTQLEQTLYYLSGYINIIRTGIQIKRS